MSQIAVYKNKEYDASINTSKGYVWLRSKSSEDLKNGFELKNGIYYKKVSLAEIDAAYDITKCAIIDGMKCEIIRETDSEYTVVFDNMSMEKALRYGLHEAIDRGMYQKTISKFGTKIEEIRKKTL